MRVHPFDEWPKHLHRADDAPIAGLSPEDEKTLRTAGYPGGVVAFDAGTEAVARAAGYSDDYQQAPESKEAPKKKAAK